MGVGYYGQVTQWSKGEYADANNLQDDLAIIDGKLSYRSDDHSDVSTSATALVRTGDTVIAASSSVSDPDNAVPSNKGIIEDRFDVDYFSVDVSAGSIDLTVTPVWVEDFLSDARRGANLDIQATLYDDLGGVVDQHDPTDDTFAQVSATVAAGRYYLAITGVGVGTPSTGYSDYGSLGQYFIEGTVPSDITYTAPPTPPSDLTAVLNGAGNGIALSWTDPASQPDTNEAGYYVFREIDGASWSLVAQLPADSSSYADNNLGNGSYAYYLEVFNGAGTDGTAATAPLTIALPLSAYATSESTSAGEIAGGSYLNTQISAGSETLREVHQGGRPSRRVSAVDHTWTVTGIAPGATVILEVDAAAPANGEGDDFDFTYSLNGGASESLGLLANGTGRQVLSAALPASASGSLTLNVVDTNRSQGSAAADTVTVYSILVSSMGDAAEQPPVVDIASPGEGFFTPEGAQFTLSGSADDFEDGDLSSSLQWSSNLDGALGGGSSVVVNTAPVPMTQGVHTLTASVTDSAGNTTVDAITVTITDPNAATNLYVDSLAGSASSSGKKWNATATAAVLDDLGDPVSGATVSGSWSGAVSGSGSCVTNASGTCAVDRNNLRHNQSSVTFTVTGVAHGALAYDGSTNLSVTITKP